MLQERHADAPYDGANVLKSHSMQLLCPVPEKLPGSHKLSPELEPSLQKLPAGHGLHFESIPLPRVEKLPAGQRPSPDSCEQPKLQYVPA